MNQERFRANLNRRLGARRAGFTLVELLMVIVVIGILSSLLVVASMSVLGTSREAATKATLSKINTMLKERMAAFETHLTNLTSPPTEAHKTLMTQNPTGAPTEVDERDAKTIYRKRQFKIYFPQTWNESSDIADPAGVTLPTTSPSSDLQFLTDSSEVLYMMLTQTSIGSQSEIGKDAFSSNEIADKDNDTYKEIVDGWGNPIVFYRWPTALIKNHPEVRKVLIPAIASSGIDINKDPDDPFGQVTATNWPNYLSDFHDPATYHVPLVVSSGADGLLGLYLPADSSNPTGQWAGVRSESENFDNLTNLNALAGGSQ